MYFVYHQVLAKKKDNEKGIFCQISEEFLKYFPTHFFYFIPTN